ncbi:MAG TPA: carboxypeptidase-like regulatory domain-containing protein, partial [Pyrinomonadaceae bacterium]
DEDPVRYVRAQFTSRLGREPDAAALYYWSRILLDCGADSACLTSQRTKLSNYLASNPAPTFDLTGRATDENGQPLAGVNVTLTGTHSSATVSTETAADGTYAFNRLPTSGAYTLAASKRHYTFTAPTATVVTPPNAQVVDFPARVNRYSIGGRLLDEGGRAIEGATLTLSGAQAATTTSDAQGNYSFANLPAGRNYTVTASSTRYTFASPSQSFTDLDANKTADFTGTSFFYGVNGQVVDSANKPVTGLSVALSGGKTAATTTDLQGKFTFTDLPRGGSYTVTPSKLFGHLFAPASKTFDNLAADQAPVFVAVPTNFKIAGRVTSNGAALAGVTVTLSGSKTGTTTTDAQGNYTFDVPVHGDYAVAPSKTHYTFDRASVSFGGVTADQTADFVATLDRFKISGSVRRANGAAMSGVTVTISNGQGSATKTTDAQGAYSFTNIPAGANYTVTPALAGYDFAPASKSFTDLGADSTADFTVTPANVAVTGRVAEGTAALAGVTVTLTGSKTGTATTDAGGNY